MEKDNIQKLLIDIGRQMVREKGTDALTVRKLSEASGCSVGAIYNQFSNMDNFIIIQNFMTLEALYERLKRAAVSDEAFTDANILVQAFVDFVLENKNLWYLLFNFHLTHPERIYSIYYLRKVADIVHLLNKLVLQSVPDMERPEQILSSQVLWLCMFAVSSFLAKDVLDPFAKADKHTICQILVNTYLAGLTVLEK